MSRPHRALLVLSAILGLFEIANAPLIDAPFVALTMAVLFLGAGFWLYRRPSSVAAPIILGLGFLVEVAGVPFYEWSSIAERITQLSVGAVSLAGLIAAITVLVVRRRSSAMRLNTRAAGTAAFGDQ